METQISNKYTAKFVLRKLRLQKDMTQIQLAKLVKVSHTTIGKYESGEIHPLIDKWIDIANVLDIPPLLFWEITENILESYIK